MTKKPDELFVVRLYDGMDNCWMDVSEPAPKSEAYKVWSEKTDGGSRMISYDEIDYYAIFPADTTMVHSVKGNAELGMKTIR
jgi:hypothetical protein